MNQAIAYETAYQTDQTYPDPDTATDAATATRSGRLSNELKQA